MSELVAVEVPCPTGAHPDGDFVYLRPQLDLAGGYAARRQINELADGATSSEVEGLLMDVYLRHGVADWTLHDADGKALAVNRQSIREQLIQGDLDRALMIGNRADALYSPAVVTPLAKRAAEFSRASRRGGSTSASTDSTPSPRKRSKRSSTSTTQTADTATTTA